MLTSLLLTLIVVLLLLYLVSLIPDARLSYALRIIVIVGAILYVIHVVGLFSGLPLR